MIAATEEHRKDSGSRAKAMHDCEMEFSAKA